MTLMDKSAAVAAVEPVITVLTERPMKTELKIKICTLAAEARIIRREENRWAKKITYTVVNHKTGETRTRTKLIRKDHPVAVSLRDHRRGVVRREARSALLAYGFLRGRPYRAMEAKSYTKPEWKRVQLLAERFAGLDPRDVRQKFEAWLSEAKGE